MKFPDRYRFSPEGSTYQSEPGNPFGCFRIPAHKACGRMLAIIAVDGEETGWEHVSVSIPGSNNPPSWEEMCLVKALFWDETECVVEYHPPKEDYVNLHTGVLHLWRSANEPFPMPPLICV